jgi:hypothetical protein
VKGVRQIVQLEDAVAVVADHMWAARKGLAALAITWDPGPNAHFSSADLVNALEDASKQPGVIARQEGDVVKAMAGAARAVEAVYQQPLLAHATMEPMNCTVHVRPDRCEVWVGTQVMARAQATAAEIRPPLGNMTRSVLVFTQSERVSVSTAIEGTADMLEGTCPCFLDVPEICVSVMRKGLSAWSIRRPSVFKYIAVALGMPLDALR